MNIEKFVPVLAVVGLIGLGVSLFLLSDYSVPLMNIAREMLIW